ncbi:hypothetical protein D3C76_1419180 [compost metagenome]
MLDVVQTNNPSEQPVELFQGHPRNQSRWNFRDVGQVVDLKILVDDLLRQDLERRQDSRLKMVVEHAGRNEFAWEFIEAPRCRVQVDSHQEHPVESQVIGKLQSQVGDRTRVKKTAFEVLAETQGFTPPPA